MEIFGTSYTLYVQAIIDGITLGVIYAAMAVGLSLTMGVMGIVNVSHSTIIMLGAFAALELAAELGFDPLIAIVAVLLIFFALGMLLQKIVVQRVSRSDPTIGLLALFGVLVIMESLMIIGWTTNTQVLPTDYGRTFIISDYLVRRPHLFAAIAGLIIIVIVHYGLQNTMLGKGIRAVAQNRDAASLMGINVPLMSMIVFGIGTATAGAGGVILGMTQPFTPQDHIKWLAWAFLVVIVGGLGNVRNTLLAGLLVGLTEAISGVLLPFQYVPVVIYSFLALALMVRGQGLAGRKARTI